MAGADIMLCVADTTARMQAQSYRFNKLRLDVIQTDTKVTKLEGSRDELLQQQKEAEDTLETCLEDLDTCDKALILLQTVSDLARQQAKGQIEQIVSQALNVVYGGDHHFTIELKNGKNGPEAFYWYDDGITKVLLKKPSYDQGGGQVDIISLALQLAVIELSGAEGPLFIDEPGQNLDKDAVPHMAYFVKEYQKTFNRQVSLITHHESLAEVGDKSIFVTKKDGVANVRNS